MSEIAITTPLRVALLCSQQIIAEYSTFLGHLLVGLADQSVCVALVCPPLDNTNPIILGTAEVITYPSFEVPLFNPLNKKLLLEKLVKFNPNILHCLCETMLPVTKYLAEQMNLPYVTAVNSLNVHRMGLSPSFFKGIGGLKPTLQNCSGIIVPAKTIENSLNKAYPHLAQKIKHINIGSFAEDAISCFSDISRPATMVIAQPFNKSSDFENLFSAIHNLVIDSYELMVVIIENGKAVTALWRLLAALDLLRIVTIIPSGIPRRPVLQASDIFIHPKPVNAFDPMLLEAMSVGSAVAACSGGVDDLIIDNETAVVFNPADELSITAALQKLLDGRDFAHKIARNAQNYVKENHSVSRMISEILQVYRK